MSEISIVTVFFDIGRGEWTPDNGLPDYLTRSTDKYFEYFGRMAKLENEMVVFTSNDLVDRVKELRGDKPTHIITLDFASSFTKLRNEIVRVQTDPEYIKKINPSQLKNPEYWNADYVVINALKSSFVMQAIKSGAITNEMVAWLDFGYCRDESVLNGINKWTTNLNNEKIHFFNLKDWVEGTTILDVISENDVHVTGPCIIAPTKLWPALEGLVHHSIGELLKNDLIDDDQTLLLMSYLFQPDLFELHKIESNDWFVVFKNFSQ
jgi:protein YibB